MLPKGWKIEQVGDLFDVQLGKMLNKEAKEKTPQFHYLGNSNVKWGHFDLSDLKMMHFSEREIEKFTLKSDDIIMCEGGEVGRCAIWQGLNQNIFYQKALHRLRSKGQIVPQFFQNYMEKISGTKLLDDYTTRTSIAHLTREKLISLPVRLPPLPEQKKIAQILSTWDKAITTTEQLLANSQQQKKALMQQLLTGKKRLLDKNGVRFSGEWESHPIKNLLQISKGNQLNKNTLSKSGEYAVINGGIEPSGYTSEYNTEANTITISEGGNSCGFVGFQSNRFWCGGHCYALKNLKIDLNFTYQLLKFNQSKIMRLRVGSGLPNIQKKDLEALSVDYPISQEEQQNIATVLSTADKEINALQQKLAALKQEKKALMQQLLTGKRRVTLN